ncbi:hypothetical protein BWQ96_08128 [Gracilariopsis chorda]|uniref:Uncharacterized protein n=1 Tax=Gracilariopsis chorda TaxID=448386 RepID=A0A2V3IM02_9FLOR|nr:hypothetical protein BWQ96_08128 [Gracilariopsis chorda]|eukprot:PXF42150.1 hypothetical protein BWQ96_08128 [Gracilariopsis chorda]
MDCIFEEEDVDYHNKPYEMETDGPAPQKNIPEVPQPSRLGYQQPQQSTAENEAEAELLRWIIEDASIPPSPVRGDRQQMLGLLRQNLGQHPTDPSV